MENKSANQLSPKGIMEIGFSFWSSKVLLSAVGFSLFTIIAKNKKMSGKEIAAQLGFKCSERATYDYLDSLVSIGMLKREGIFQTSIYQNSETADYYLDKAKLSYVGGILEMLNSRLYNMWGLLQQNLKTGLPWFQSHSNGANPFAQLYKHPDKLKVFVDSMTGFNRQSYMELANKFDFSSYSTLVDAGGAAGELSIQVAKKHPHMKCISFDLPPVQSIAKENIEKHHLTQQVITVSGDFFKEDLPKADIVIMGLILHDWNMEEKKLLIKRAFDAVKPGGAFIAVETIIDSDRKEHLFGLTMSLNMLIETSGGFDFSFQEFEEWTKAAGFTSYKLIILDQFKKAAVAYK